MRKAIVYRITSPSGKAYIGVTINLAHRLWKHEHANSLVGHSLRKYGREAHVIEALVVAAEDYAYELEPRLIALYGTVAPKGLNVQSGGFSGMRGFRQRPETRQKVREIKREYYAARGGVRTAEEKARISAGCRGKPKGPQSQAHRDAIQAGKRQARQARESVAE